MEEGAGRVALARHPDEPDPITDTELTPGFAHLFLPASGSIHRTAGAQP